MKTFFIFFLISLLGTGCIPNPSFVKKGAAQFGLTKIPAGWIQKSFRGANLYFAHATKNAAIFFTTQCEQISDSPLEALASQMLVGFTDITITRQEYVTIAEREALLTELTAKVDGVQVFLKNMVLKKNRCVFDAVLSASGKDQDLIADFDAMIGHFWAEADL